MLFYIQAVLVFMYIYLFPYLTLNDFIKFPQKIYKKFLYSIIAKPFMEEEEEE